MDYEYVAPVEEKKSNGLALASLICAAVGFCCCNPLYLVSMTAVVLGIIALTKKQSKGMAIAGISIGAGSIIFCLICDLITCWFSYGATFFL